MNKVADDGKSRRCNDSRGNSLGNIVRQALQSFRQARQRIKCRTPELLVIAAEHSRQSACRLRVRGLTQHPRGQSPYILVPNIGWGSVLIGHSR